jgi:hypothetical protein
MLPCCLFMLPWCLFQYRFWCLNYSIRHRHSLSSFVTADRYDVSWDTNFPRPHHADTLWLRMTNCRLMLKHTSNVFRWLWLLSELQTHNISHEIVRRKFLLMFSQSNIEDMFLPSYVVPYQITPLRLSSHSCENLAVSTNTSLNYFVSLTILNNRSSACKVTTGQATKAQRGSRGIALLFS